ncbi:MAG: hypothetical protein ONB43_05615 [candidate division KSB1 bacterium]|nr:hypothetical protein [candidate division KSB1 bacterium]
MIFAQAKPAHRACAKYALTTRVSKNQEAKLSCSFMKNNLYKPGGKMFQESGMLLAKIDTERVSILT